MLLSYIYLSLTIEPNKNIAWVRGEALITFYLGILVFCRLLLWILNFSPHTSWTIINVAHCIVSFFFFFFEIKSFEGNTKFTFPFYLRLLSLFFIG